MTESGTGRHLYLSKPFDRIWEGRDPFAEVGALEGEVFRDVPGRRTLRFTAAGHSWFLKYHSGIGWAAVLSEWLRGRAPVTGAGQEWRAIRALEEAGVKTLSVAAFGERGRSPASRESFLITADLEETEGEPLVDLETLCALWVQQAPLPRSRRTLLERVAQISRRLHGAGITHRDFYLCHFLLPQSQSSGPAGTPKDPVLIDLHRALVRPPRLQRWIEKDLAGLWFSARYAGLTNRDMCRFIRIYTGGSVRQAYTGGQQQWQRIARRREAMLRREQRRQQRLRSELLLAPPGSPVAQWHDSDRAGKRRILRGLTDAVRRCHAAGWLPVDRALRDVRRIGGRLAIELTGAERVGDSSMPAEQACRVNLATFLSWFPAVIDESLEDIDPLLPELLRPARVERWQRIAGGLYRNTADVRRLRRDGAVIVHKRRLVSPDWESFMEDPDGRMRSGRVVKDGDTTTVVQLSLGGRDCMVKRYDPASTAHAPGQAPQPGRAWRHWYHAHRLLTLGACTPEPLLVMERRIGSWRRQAWLVTESIAGRDLLQEVETLEDPETGNEVMQQFLDWFRFMRHHRVNHGDLEISNFISTPSGLWVLDLDGMRWPGSRSGFERGFVRDCGQFMRNWRRQPALQQQADRMLRSSGILEKPITNE